ncbi:aspartyl protease family protein [Croceibacterium soli]|nr:aspartyl protease family protein [Croceibacterium soli]
MMSWLHLLSALAAATATTTTIEPGAPVVPEDAEILQLEKERYERLTLPVTIQGKGPYRFMIDTGAEATVVSTALADTLQIADRRPATLVGMASTVATETVDIAEFMLGSRSLYIRTAPLVAAEHLGGMDGILGLDSLQDQRVLLDFENKVLAVADAEDLGGNRGFEIVVKARERLGQLIITRAELDGVETTVVIDTGAQSSVGNLALFERLRRGRDLGESQLTDVSGYQLSGPVRVAKDLSLGRLLLRNIPVLFIDAPPFRALNLADKPALILGMRELRAFRRVAIDFKKRQVLFDLPRGVYPLDRVYGGRIGA